MHSYRAAALVAVFGLMGCTDREPVVIGVAMGETECVAARLAFEDATREGFQVEIDTLFVYSDDTRATGAIQAAEQLLAVPGIVAVIGHGHSAASLAASPLYNAREVVQLAPHSTSTLYSSAGPYSYRLVPADDRQGRYLAERLNEEARGRRVAVLYVNDDYGRGLRHEVMNATTRHAIDWVLDLPHVERDDQTALTRTVESLAAARPEMILWLGRAGELARLLPDIRRTLGDVAILGSDAVSEAVGFSNPEGRWNGVRFVELVDVERPAVRAFRARYRQRVGREPYGGEILAYDAMRLLLEAINAGARSGDDVRRYLDSLGRESVRYEGVSGPIEFDSAGDVARGYVMREIAPTTRS